MKLRATLVAAIAAFAGLTATAPAATTAVTKCVTVYDFPDAGSKVCVDTEGWCLLGEYRTTFIGTEFYCYVRNP